ncbi:hypothetical protein [Micromonospora globbae]|jgi:hypothetical protein|uniref:Uncharacterized protein n=1 Tax=Micromonospora globbae TaxID=1894969 RepID=A0A420ETH0_9ACTN|nr:hypothetical protein [Micromonospora globbae]RKF23988.1 hypothetical protein D7I43_28720 [Micromonospora globbae]WTF88189.1 hypothetical protein OH732_11705 [Micromonospora globbae]
MSERHTALRSMHDLGLAAWFGGSLMGALGVNGAAAKINDATQRLPVASAGWSRWTPVNAAAIGAHLAGAVGELVTESPRVAAQAGVARASAIKTALTVGALAVTGYSRLLGMRLQKAGGPPVDGVTEPNHQTPAQVAASQRQMKMLQWAVPALTGALVVVTAYMSEQQKPGQMWRGLIGRAGGLMSAPKGMAKIAGVSKIAEVSKMAGMGKMAGMHKAGGMGRSAMRRPMAMSGR